MPNLYLKLLYPDHANDKILIVFKILQGKNTAVMKFKSKIQLIWLIQMLEMLQRYRVIDDAPKTYLYNL